MLHDIGFEPIVQQGQLISLRKEQFWKKRLRAKKMTAVSCFIYPRINHKVAYKNSCLGLINNLETPIFQAIVISTGQLSKL